MLVKLCSKSFKLASTVNRELLDVKAGFRKGRRTRDQIAKIFWITEKARRVQKNIYFFFDFMKAFDCMVQQTVGNYSRGGNTLPPYLSPEKPVCRSRRTVRTGHGTMDWFKIGKGIWQNCTLSPCLFHFYEEPSLEILGCMTQKLESGLLKEIPTISDMQMVTFLWQKVKRN